MKKKIFYKIFIFFTLFSNTIFAQNISDIAEFINAGTKNTETLMEGYLTPFANMLGADLNGGWYNTAKPHSLLGFDITLTTSLSISPKSDETFSIAGLENLISDKNELQSFSGSTDRANLTFVDDNGNPISKFESPEGIGVNAIPLPMLQAGFGVGFGTEIIGRFVPKIELGDFGSIRLWGVGVKHSLKQWIPVLSHVPFLQMSGLVAYTKVASEADISLGGFEGQNMEINTSALITNLIVSGKLPVIPITLYGGIGYSMTKTNIKLNGDYSIPSLAGNNVIINNPIDLDIENQSALRVNAGIRLNLFVFFLNFDYTYANYSVYTAGLGFSFR